MNKFMSVVVKRKIFPLYSRHVIQPQLLYFSSGTFPFSLSERDNYQKFYLRVFPYVTISRQMGVLATVKQKLYSKISDKTKVKVAACLTYEKIADTVDYQELFRYFELPDTLQSWFSCMQLHVWLTLATTIAEKYGRPFRTQLVNSMWTDVELRMEQLTTLPSSTRKANLKEFVMQFQASLVSYDEGLLSDDTVLAGAVWRTLFARKVVDPQLLENAVSYIRRQLSHLDSLNTQEIILKGSINFLPLSSVLSDDNVVEHV